jgi:hypothetical protein
VCRPEGGRPSTQHRTTHVGGWLILDQYRALWTRAPRGRAYGPGRDQHVMRDRVHLASCGKSRHRYPSCSFVLSLPCWGLMTVVVLVNRVKLNSERRELPFFPMVPTRPVCLPSAAGYLSAATGALVFFSTSVRRLPPARTRACGASENKPGQSPCVNLGMGCSGNSATPRSAPKTPFAASRSSIDFRAAAVGLRTNGTTSRSSAWGWKVVALPPPGRRCRCVGRSRPDLPAR